MNIRVLGLGNVLMSDDGFGPYVVRVIDAFYDVRESVQVIDAGRPGLDLAPYLLGADVVILIDTLTITGRPGEIHTYDLDDIVAHSSEPLLSPHDPGIRAALLRVGGARSGPSRVLLVGVVPEWEATGVQLSPALREAVAPAIGLIVKELERHGAAPALRAAPRTPDTWWERRTDRRQPMVPVI
jgi:hydrogenase maturation protease